MRMVKPLLLGILIFLTFHVWGQERLFWDFPEPIRTASDGRFPVLLTANNQLALVWQEFSGEKGSLDSTLSLKAQFSPDGVDWTSPVLTIAEDIPYLWANEVPLFSAVALDDGRLVVAVAAGTEGVAVFGQNDPFGEFETFDLVPSGQGAADAAVAPRLARTPQGSFLLFLTRRTTVVGGARPTTLTSFLSQSQNGRNWTSPELFVDPAQDRAGDGTPLEQNFLPVYFSQGTDEYVAFQSLRQGSEGQVYQIYTKVRRKGGDWSPAISITEGLVSSDPRRTSLDWDNQRPSLGADENGQILLAWERRGLRERPHISLVALQANGSAEGERVENVVLDRYTSASPQITTIRGGTWILWFDDTGIRLAQRNGAFDYDIQAASLDAQSRGADRGTASFPMPVVFQGATSVLWEDFSGGRSRSVLLRPDLRVDAPGLQATNFRSGQPGNFRGLSVDWGEPVDSSGILSYSWLWSQNAQDEPSRRESDQLYDQTRSYFEIPGREQGEGEGLWYFSLIAHDQAGNWSEPLRLTYVLDETPPPPPLVGGPPTDSYGYLDSNTFELSWTDGELEEAAFYRWRMDYLAASPERLDLDVLQAFQVADGRQPFQRSGAAESSERRQSWVNLDNGVWAFTVVAVDQAGNQGPPSTRLLFTNRYVDVTFITGASASRDEADRIILEILGRGFAAGGDLDAVVLDRDGEEPWDYSYRAGAGGLDVLSDRLVRVVGIEEMEAGTYRVGVVHPLRGTVFWNRTMRLDATGNVKFGPYGLYAYAPLWEPVALALRLTGNQFLDLLLLLTIAMAMLLSTWRLISLAREMRVAAYNAQALLNGGELSLEARQAASQSLRRKGMGLRTKFTLSLSALVMITIAMIASVLGVVWIRMERDALAEGLENESRLLVETLSSSAQNSIPAAERGDLLLLPDRISALQDALWTTVTGPRGELVNGVLGATSEGSEYVWASNDPDVLNKLELPDSLPDFQWRQLAELAGDEDQERIAQSYVPVDGSYVLRRPESADERTILSAYLRELGILPSEAGLGQNRVDDELSAAIEMMRRDVEQAAQDAGIARMISELEVLEQQYTEFAQQVVLTLDFENPAYVEAEQAVAAQKKEIETLLLELSGERFASYPEFNAESLRPGGPEFFVFYKPLLYRVGNQDVNFFRGTVRLAVSVQDIRTSLALVQNRIILITSLASAAALGFGVLVAMFISSLMLRPIRAVYKGVSLIREQPDMLQHEDFDVSLRTKDELSELADTINDMVRGLVQAAIEQKELIAGQEIQKTFLPLVKDEKSGKKLSIGGAENAYFRLFGYYEGADAVSGDYFDFRQLDDDHYVMIKLDIAGHGVTASLIMVQVAALYVDYFRKVREKAKQTGKLRYNLREFTFGINDLINEVGFKGRFAAFNLSVVNVRTAEYQMIHAGDNLVHIYDAKKKKMKVVELPESPATGQIDSFMIEMNPTMYKEVKGRLNRGDVLFLYTDGIEEAHHILRDESFEIITYENLPEEIRQKDAPFVEAGYKPMDETQDNEEFDPVRIDAVIEAAMHRGEYVLERRCDMTIGKPLHFDFTTLEGTGEDAVMALASVEKVFRLIPDDSGGANSRVRVDRKIVEFLKKHFKEFREFYKHPVDDDGHSPYVHYSHLREDPQDDDLTIWAYQRL